MLKLTSQIEIGSIYPVLSWQLQVEILNGLRWIAIAVLFPQHYTGLYKMYFAHKFLTGREKELL